MTVAPCVICSSIWLIGSRNERAGGLRAEHFQRVDDADAGGGQLADLMVKLGALVKLAGREDERHNARARARSGGDLVEAGLQVALAAEADDLFGHLAVLEKQQRGDGADAVFGGEGLVVVNVDLADVDAAGIFLREFIEDRARSSCRGRTIRPRNQPARACGDLMTCWSKVVLGQGEDVGGGHV